MAGFHAADQASSRKQEESVTIIQQPRPEWISDLTGQRFGAWMVISYCGYKRYSGTTTHYWSCRCDCGSEHAVTGGSLRAGRSTRCVACHPRRELHGATDGRRRDPLYTIWQDMKGRCDNKNHPYFYKYGGRGVQVCERWRKSFAAFRAEVDWPGPYHRLELINQEGSYAPGNVRWIAKKRKFVT